MATLAAVFASVFTLATVVAGYWGFRKDEQARRRRELAIRRGLRTAEQYRRGA